MDRGDRNAAVIVGAGPAGLAVGACLRARGVPFVLLEREARPAASWSRHYDRLHLHTHKRNSGLPGRPWPDDAPDYPARDEVVGYLESYAAAFDLRPHLGEAAQRAWREDGAWQVESERGRYVGEHLVVASGLNDRPHRPTWPGLERFPGAVLHSSEYRNGVPFRERRALVVGFGNSGGEIAVDLVEHGARVALAVRSAVNVVPRRVLGMPVEEVATRLGRLPAPVADAVGRAVRRLRYGDMTRYGLRFAPFSPTRQVQERARIPLIDAGTVEHVRAGRIAVRPGLVRFEGERAVFEDGTDLPLDVVVLATGFRAGYPSLLEGLGELPAELPLALPRAPGLHFCGFVVTAGGTLARIAQEAQTIGAVIGAAFGVQGGAAGGGR